MSQKCQAFDFDDAKEAWEHMNFQILEDYGDYAYGHLLHTWDDGKRMLARCKTCGGYILIQKSEFHSFSDGDDSYYADYFPVKDELEAYELNRKYNGFEIEEAFPERYLRRDNLALRWSSQRKKTDG